MGFAWCLQSISWKRGDGEEHATNEFLKWIQRMQQVSLLLWNINPVAGHWDLPGENSQKQIMGIGFSLRCHRYVFRWLKATASKESPMASIKGACWNEMKLILSSLLHLGLGYILSLWLANISTRTSFLCFWRFKRIADCRFLYNCLLQELLVRYYLLINTHHQEPLPRAEEVSWE